MSVLVVQYSDKGILFLSDSRQLEQVNGVPTGRYTDSAVKLFRVPNAVFSATDLIAVIQRVSGQNTS
jgi:hypothetical protein